MNCEEIQDLISTEYLDGELNAFSRQAIDAHLKHCDQCFEYKEEVFRVNDRVSELLETESVPVHLWGQVKTSLEASARVRKPAHLVSFPVWSFKNIMSGLGAAAIFLIAIQFYPSMSSQQSQRQNIEIAQERNYLQFLLEEDITVPVSYNMEHQAKPYVMDFQQEPDQEDHAVALYYL